MAELSMNTGALISSMVMYSRKLSEAAARSPDPLATEATSFAERAAWATTMAACTATAWPRCPACCRLSNWFTTRTVTSRTSRPATVSVVSGRAAHHRRSPLFVSSPMTSATVITIASTAASHPSQRVVTRRLYGSLD